MKKLIALVSAVICVVSLSLTAYAQPLTDYSLTGTVDFDSESSSTFSDTKIISGTAPEGTTVTITVDCPSSGTGETLAATVGASELFTKTITLSNGANDITVTLSLPGYDDVTMTTTINKKESKIKRALEKGIYIPGENIGGDIILFYSR